MNYFHRFISNRALFFAFVAAAAAVMMFNRLGQAPLAGDDCYYSEVAKEMALNRDYLSPRNGGVVDFHTSKPPMLYWMNALSGNLFGFTSFAMRLPSAILGFLGVLALMFFVDRYWNAFTAGMAALILAFTQQYLYHARSAVTDGPFAVFFGLALMAFWAARTEKKPVYFYLTGLCIGLAVMTRQIPGLFILPVIGAYILLSREFSLLKNPHLYGGLLLAAAVIMPWHIVMYLRHGDHFLRQYFQVALMTGLSGYPVEYAGNPSLNPWYAYGEILLSNYWPWLPFLAVGIVQTLAGLRSILPSERRRNAYLLLWALLPLAIFQAAKVKQYHYIMPLYIPFAVLSASVFDRFRDPVKLKAAAWVTGLCAAFALASLLFPILPKTLDSHEYVDTITMIPEVRRIPGEIVTLDKGFCHFNNCFQFYGDKRTVHNAEEELVAKLRSPQRYYFVLFRDAYDRIIPAAGRRPVIIKTARDSVLFSNN